MIERAMLYDILYALAARDGREAALFGDCMSLAREAFARSLAGTGFPELWFELPLAGKPWFDLHALASQSDFGPDAVFAPETCGGNPDVFAWFAAQEGGVRQLALSWDVSSGDISNPAVQLLVTERNEQLTSGFLAAAGRQDAIEAYRTFVGRLPEEWFACYAGVFPARPGHNLRVECIPSRAKQRAYANDVALLEAHLRQTGFADFGDTVLPRCHQLANTPFRLEFQFDVNPDGSASTTLGASVRFAVPLGTEAWHCFDPQGEAGTLMRQVEGWGLADERWQLLADTTFAQRVAFSGASTSIYCFPAFLKLRWRGGEPLDAKAYLMAGVQ